MLEKILGLDSLALVIEKEKAKGLRIVHCHGVYDLMHIGHIKHLSAAKKMGDILVVTITQDKHVNKGPNRPVFTASLRAEALSALGCVDYVAINDWPSAVETISKLKPNIYVKGFDGQGQRDHSDAIEREKQAIEAVGGKLVFTDEETYSSSAIINRHMDIASDDVRNFIGRIKNNFTAEQVVDHVKSIMGTKVLVIGESIIDEYVFCQTMGKANKDPVLAALFKHSDKYAGGSIAIANHVASFCGPTGLISMLGDEDSHAEFIRSRMAANVEAVFMQKHDSPTIVKRRFLEEYMAVKLFEMYVMRNENLRGAEERSFIDKLEELLPSYNVVIVADYGHGMMTDKIIELVCSKAKFLAVNAQTNAGNRGFNPISRYKRADFVCIDEPEARIEMRDRDADSEALIKGLAGRIDCKKFMLTMGKKGSLCLDVDHGMEKIPVFGARLVDRMGAGDAVLAVTAPCVAMRMPMSLVGLVGNLVGAEACTIMGNARAVDSSSILRHITHIMK